MPRDGEGKYRSGRPRAARANSAIDDDIPGSIHVFISVDCGARWVFMNKPLMRIPYTGPLPPPTIFPRSANTLTGARHALTKFLAAARPESKTVLLTGAGISVASGLADYRGTGGTYTLNKTYRPIYYHEFISNHEARKRYWARSYLGWTTLNRAQPNAAHWAVKALGEHGLVGSVITQSMC